MTPGSYVTKWSHRIDFRQAGGISRNRTFYFKTRYLNYYFVSRQMRDYDYGHSLLSKQPYLVTELASSEVRTQAILGEAVRYGHAVLFTI